MPYALVFSLFLALAQKDQNPEIASSKLAIYTPQAVFTDLDIGNQATWIGRPVGGRGDWFLLTQVGRIFRITGSRESHKLELVLDFSDRTLFTMYQGAYGMAFHPAFKTNGRIYVHYINRNREMVLSEFTVGPEAAKGQSGMERKLIVEAFPFKEEDGSSLNQGGAPVFGPDGYLYLPIGDGGPQGDPEGHGQNLETLKGKVLRIDVNTSIGKAAYRIPDDNPFFRESKVNPKVRGEIWAYGFRMPWRLSFDHKDGKLWLADVGFKKREEIDIVVKGGNYGWNLREGTWVPHPEAKENSLTLAKLEAPVAEFNRVDMKCIIGGFVYHGKAHPELEGAYFYGDYSVGTVSALVKESGSYRSKLLFNLPMLVSMAEDEQGEPIFLCLRKRNLAVGEEPVLASKDPLENGSALFEMRTLPEVTNRP